MTIKEMRETSGLSQIKICELTGVPTRTWRSWETGERACPEYVVRLIRYFLENEGVLKMKRWNVEVNWFGAYGADGWQVVNDEPFKGENEDDVFMQIDDEWLNGCLSVNTENGVEPVEGAEYRIVPIK